MSSEHEHSAEEFARRLASLTPAAALTRDRVLFEAGRNAGRKEARPWRYVASIMTVGMVGLLAFETMGGKTPPMASNPPRQLAEQQPQTVLVQSEPEPTPEYQSRLSLVNESNEYLHLRDLILRRGVDALPLTMTASASPKKTESKQSNDGDDRAWWRLRMKQMGGASL